MRALRADNQEDARTVRPYSELGVRGVLGDAGEEGSGAIFVHYELIGTGICSYVKMIGYGE